MTNADGTVDVDATAYAIEKQLKVERAIAENIDYSEVPRSAFGVQKKINAYEPDDFLKKGNEWRDLFAQDSLAIDGHKVVPREANAPDGFSNIDAYVDGRLFEFKSPEPQKKKPKHGKELDFIDRNLHKAVNQFKSQYDPLSNDRLIYDGPINIVLNLRYRPIDTRKAKAAIKKSMKDRGINEVIIITAEGKIISVK